EGAQPADGDVDDERARRRAPGLRRREVRRGEAAGDRDGQGKLVAENVHQGHEAEHDGQGAEHDGPHQRPAGREANDIAHRHIDYTAHVGTPGDDSDRREHARAPIELKVEYTKLNTFFADYTKNICKGGTFIKTRKPLEVGTEFVFKLLVPRLGDPLALRGQVKWVVREGEEPPPEAGSDGHEPGMGIRFIYASDAERSAI